MLKIHLKQNFQFSIKKCEDVVTKHFNDSKAFNEYSNMVDIYENIEECNPNKKRKILTVFDDIIVDMHSKKKLNPIATESFIRGRKCLLFYLFYLFYSLFYYENFK